MRWRLLFAVLSLGASVACGGSDSARPTANREPQSSAEPPVSSTPPASYSVHEWGLLRAVGTTDALDASAVPQPRPALPLTVDKPVLYFHATDDVQLARVRVRAVGGTIREHWPLTAPGSSLTEVEWREIELRAARSVGPGQCDSRSFPSLSDPPCNGLPAGEFCESAQLGPLRAEGATCAGPDAPFLFYRSRTETFTPPLRLVLAPSGEVTATLTGPDPLPGQIVRLERTGDSVRAIAVQPPAPGHSVSIGAQAVAVDRESADSPAPPRPRSQVEAGRRAIRTTMTEIGLEENEVAAFLRAWDGALFGLEGMMVDTLTTDETDRVPGTVHSVLYFLPPSAASQVAELTFEPAPRAIHRALAVWVRLEPSI